MVNQILEGPTESQFSKGSGVAVTHRVTEVVSSMVMSGEEVPVALQRERHRRLTLFLLASDSAGVT